MKQLNNRYQLSIIVPVYNVEQYIRSCMESIFQQGLNEEDYEVIIVNDGTQDHSMEMIEDIINEHSNITVINQENQGVSDARNNGIAKAKGEYILMPDSDDLLIENSLSLLLEKALESKADLVVADFLEMNDEEIAKIQTISQKELHVKEKTGRELFMEDLNPRQCYIWRTLYRRAFLIENHLTFVPGVNYQDVPFIHECYLKAKKCLRVSWLLNIYRRGHESATYSFNIRKAGYYCIVIANLWSLRTKTILSEKERVRLDDNIFVTFSILNYFMLYGIRLHKDKKEILHHLLSVVPDLKFSNGIKQKVTSILLRNTPGLYLYIRQLLKWCSPSPNFDVTKKKSVSA